MGSHINYSNTIAISITVDGRETWLELLATKFRGYRTLHEYGNTVTNSQQLFFLVGNHQNGNSP